MPAADGSERVRIGTPINAPAHAPEHALEEYCEQHHERRDQNCCPRHPRFYIAADDELKKG